jgi:glycerophosphoryl diester phosphodiesterase
MTSIVAHRGYSTRFLENSPPAWHGAVEVGADFVEADIRFTGDGEAVCCHDADFRRLAADDTRVDEIGHDALAALRSRSPGVAPDFAELLANVPTTTGLLLDVKDESPAALERLHHLVLVAGREIILGLHALSSVQAMAARGHRAILALMPDRDGGTAFLNAGASIIRLWEADVSGERVEVIARRGAPVWVTTGEGTTGRRVGDHDEADLRRMAGLGVGGFLVNDPAAARTALAGPADGGAR